MFPVLKMVSNLSTADGLAIQEVLRAGIGGFVTGSDGGAGSGAGLASSTGFKCPATTAADSLVSVMSLSPNTARGQVSNGGGFASGPEIMESVEVMLLVPLLLLPLLLLLAGDVELEVLKVGELLESFWPAASSAFVLLSSVSPCESLGSKITTLDAGTAAAAASTASVS